MVPVCVGAPFSSLPVLVLIRVVSAV
jgi:hypothetical protein